MLFARLAIQDLDPRSDQPFFLRIEKYAWCLMAKSITS